MSYALKKHGLQEVILHTGQHFDVNMSHIFFEELGIPKPAYNLGVAGGTHGMMTGQMLERIEAVIQQERPDAVLVYGDTNSTLAGALAAVKLHIPVAHVEAGLRSHNRRMPEEHNRVLTDHISQLLFCPTQTAIDNLAVEGILDQGHETDDFTRSSFDRPRRVFFVGDVMFDVVLHFSTCVREEGRGEMLCRKFGDLKEYALCTLHRAENTDDLGRLRAIFDALVRLAAVIPVICPLHPRTRGKIDAANIDTKASGLILVDPVGYLDMMALLDGCRVVLTDSGGLQKEAAFLGRPCVTMRDETEWVETVQQGWNVVVGADADRIVAAALSASPVGLVPLSGFGNGSAARKVAGALGNWLM